MRDEEELMRLGELVCASNEKAVGRKRSDWPYVGLEHLESGSPRLLGTAPSSYSTSTNSIFRAGDVLFGKLRPYLRKSVGVAFDGYCSTDILVLRPHNGVDPGFAAKLLHSEPVFAEAVATSIGTKMPRTSWAALSKLKVFCPPTVEQPRVAEILDTLDEAIRRTEQVIAKLQQMKQGLLHDLLTRGIDDNGELRDPDRTPGQFKDSPLGRIPAAWDDGPFERYERADRPFLKTGPFGSNLKGEHWSEGGIPVITIGALGEGELLASELLFVSERKAAELTAYAVEPGDIVFSRVADVGRSVVISRGESGWLMSSNLMWISLDPRRVHAEYVWLNLSANDVVRQQVRRSVNAGGREVANGEVLRSLRLPWPDLSEQRRIVNAAQALHQRLSEEESTAEKLKSVMHGLMQDLLTGKVRVQAVQEVLT
jgi:type I restriction enzyme S subunit